MPKRKSGYALSDDEGDANGFESASKQLKATKSTKRSKQAASASPRDTPALTTTHFADAPPPSTPKKESDGTLYWEISKARRVTLSSYNGKKLVGIREYYEKEGQWLPGKKGISMSLEQYGALVSLLPRIEDELSRDGIKDIPRPDYEGVARQADDEEDIGDDDAGPGGRANHEATSDEDE